MLGKDDLWRKTNPKKYPDGSADGLPRNHGTEQNLRLATTVPWTGKTAVVCNDQPDCKGGVSWKHCVSCCFQNCLLYQLRYE